MWYQSPGYRTFSYYLCELIDVGFGGVVIWQFVRIHESVI